MCAGYDELVRGAVLVLLAMSSCRRDDRRQTTPEASIENKSTTTPAASVENKRTTVVRNPTPIPVPQPCPTVTSGPPNQRVPCVATPNARNACITFSAINRSTHNVDLCRLADAALARVNGLAR